MGWKNLFGKKEPTRLGAIITPNYLSNLQRQNGEMKRRINNLESELLDFGRAKGKIKELEIKLKYSENAQHINKIAELQEENSALRRELEMVVEGYNWQLAEQSSIAVKEKSKEETEEEEVVENGEEEGREETVEF